MKYQLHNRRYIGNKYKLLSFIDEVINTENLEFDSFADIFAGTGVVGEHFFKKNKKVFFNDMLFANYIFYNAFFSKQSYSEKKIIDYIQYYNKNSDYIEENYFSDTFSNTYFSYNNAKKIGSIREHIEKNKDNLTEREYYILLTSLLYTVDKVANTVGHFEAFLSSPPKEVPFELKEIEIHEYKADVEIYNQDSNQLVKNIKADIAYIDPPYNARQYINFYHLLENLAEWKKPEVFGKTLKMEREAKKSDYSKAKAYASFKELVSNIQAKYILVSYNNTYKANSGASINKILQKDIVDTLNQFGSVSTHEIDYKHFNSGKTKFNNHKEFLYLCKTN